SGADEVLVPVVATKSRQPAKKEQKKEAATATNNERQKHRQSRAAGIDLMGAGDADGTCDEVPYQRDQSTTAGHKLERRGRALRKSDDTECRLKTFFRSAEEHEGDVDQRAENKGCQRYENETDDKTHPTGRHS